MCPKRSTVRQNRLGRMLACTLLLLSTAAAWAGAAAPLKSIAILDFELVDDPRDTVPDTTAGPRLPTIPAPLRAEFAQAMLYRLVDTAPAAAQSAKFEATQEIRTCNGCELEIARSLGVDRVAIDGVQKVGNLILNLDVQIEDARPGEILPNQSVDLRGNTDTPFRRGIGYLVQGMVDRHQGNR